MSVSATPYSMLRSFLIALLASMAYRTLLPRNQPAPAFKNIGNGLFR
jgi:hypothetical protein